MKFFRGSLCWGKNNEPVLVFSSRAGWFANWSPSNESWVSAFGGPFESQKEAEEKVLEFLNAIAEAGAENKQ